MKLNLLATSCCVLSSLLFSTSPSLSQTTPKWLENDSTSAIKSRLLSDFSIPWEEGIVIFAEKYGIDEATLADWEAQHFIETKNIDGKKRVHRKSVGNARLLNPLLNGGWSYRGDGASDVRISYVDSVLRAYDGNLPTGKAHKVRYRFSIDVPYNDALLDDTIKVWFPLPLETQRQKDIKILSTSQRDYILSDGKSVHNSIYFEKPVVKDSTTHFDYEAEFITMGEYFAPEYIIDHLKPYDKNDSGYIKYTSFEAPHIINLSELAKNIVGNETNPYRQSEKVFNYIVTNYPWAGAREYSTIECIPQYVLDEKHGDCGQVSLLYISLMRSLGVPARWESGWMLHPHEKNLHDWAEVYFNGVGWVPVDVSFGRYLRSEDARIQRFYSTGMDAHRFATNQGVGGKFYPPKKYVRSETVDAQLGEVESTKGNLFYPGWKQSLKLIEVTPIEQ